jgi:hypothetical protein
MGVGIGLGTGGRVGLGVGVGLGIGVGLGDGRAVGRRIPFSLLLADMNTSATWSSHGLAKEEPRAWREHAVTLASL